MTTLNKLLIAVLLVVAAFGVVFFFGTHKNNTPNWKTYKNETLGFELQYPSALEVVDNTAKMLNDYVETDKKCLDHGGCGGGPRPSWEIDFLSASDKQIALLVYRGISLKTIYGVKAPVGEEQFLTDYFIGGQPGLRNVQKGFPANGQGPSLLYGVDYKGKTFSFTFPNKTASAQDLEYAEKIVSTFKFINQTTDLDQNTVNTLVKNFYGAIESQDGKLLFSYITPPSTDKEKADFSWLTGADLVGTPIYRAFFRQKISSPKIGDTQKIDDVTYVVKVSDQLLVIPSAGSETVVYTPQPRNVVLTIIKSGDKWLVDKFTNPSNTSNTGNAGSPKYNGFGQ